MPGWREAGVVSTGVIPPLDLVTAVVLAAAMGGAARRAGRKGVTRADAPVPAPDGLRSPHATRRPRRLPFNGGHTAAFDTCAERRPVSTLTPGGVDRSYGLVTTRPSSSVSRKTARPSGSGDAPAGRPKAARNTPEALSTIAFAALPPTAISTARVPDDT